MPEGALYKQQFDQGLVGIQSPGRDRISRRSSGGRKSPIRGIGRAHLAGGVHQEAAHHPQTGRRTSRAQRGAAALSLMAIRFIWMTERLGFPCELS